MNLLLFHDDCFCYLAPRSTIRGSKAHFIGIRLMPHSQHAEEFASNTLNNKWEYGMQVGRMIPLTIADADSATALQLN
jgi:hypothetical protein